MIFFTTASKSRNYFLTLAFLFVCMLLNNSLQAQLRVIGSSPFQDSIWAVDTATIQMKLRAAPSLVGFTVTGMNGLCFDPITGNYYVIAKLSGVTGRVLCTVDISTMILAQVGNLGDNFSSITCSPNGQLYGATGNGASVPETLYKINKTNGAKTLLKAMGNGVDGEIIVYHPTEHMIYHWSGNGTVVFEKMDTTAVYSPINIPISGGTAGETFGAAYVGNNKFLISNISSSFNYMTTSGVNSGTFGSLPDDLRGLAFTRLDFNSNLTGTSYCAGGTYSLPYTNLSFQSGNTFSIEVLALGDTTPTVIGTVSQSAENSGANVSVTFPTNLASGSYKLRIKSSNPVMISPSWTQPTITIVGQPTAPSIAISGTANDSTTICANTNVTLTAVTGGGSMAEYLWLKNGVVVNYQNGGAGTYTVNSGLTAGTDVYSLRVLYTGGQCVSDTSLTATVINATPTATITPAGPTTFCSNTPTTLNANAGMTNYLWKRSTTPVQNGASSAYIPTASGNHSVTVTNSNGCSKTSAFTNIVRNLAPTANAGTDKNLCVGSSVQIGATNNVNNTYTWSPNTNLSNAFVSNPISSATVTTDYTVVVTNIFTGCSASDLVNVASLALPSAPTVAVSGTGNTRILTPTAAGAIAVNWYRDGVAIYNNLTPNATISVPVSNPTKAYTAKAKGANGCLSLASTAVNVRIGNDKEGDMILSDNANMVVYPNPTTGKLAIEINNNNLNSEKLYLYNNVGQIVLEETIDYVLGKANIDLDISSLAAGVYILSIGSETQRIVKE